MIPSFYNAADQELYKKYQFIPQEQYRLGLNLPTDNGDAVTDQGIVNTNAFVNAGGDGGGETKYDNSFLPDLPTFNYVDTVRKYGADSKQAKQMLEKAGGTYPDGSYMTDGGFEYTNSFPNTSVQMQDLNYNPTVSSTGNVRSGYNRMGGYLDEGSQITGNPVGVGTGSPITNFKGVSIAPSFATDGVRTVNGNLSKIANPEIYDTVGSAISSRSKSNPMFEGKKGFEDYSQDSFEETEEEEKKGFIANMISRANQIGSSVPDWAKTAAKSYGLGTLLANPFAMVLPVLSGIFGSGRSTEQFDPRGSFRGGVYTMDGVHYANPSMHNEFYDPITGTNRFDRAPKGSFGSFRTLSDYFNRNKNDNTNTNTNNDGDGGSGNVGGTGTAAAADTSQGQTGYGSCFIAGTKVTMADGTLKNIEDVVVGDKVKGHKEENTVIKLDPTLLATRKLYSFNNNEHYFFTSEHPFMTEQGWKSIKPEKTKERDGVELYEQLKGELKIGDKLVTDKGLIEITDIKSKEINNPEMPLYNFNVSNDNSYIADGYVVHNKGGDGGQQNNGPDASGTEGEDQGRFAADGGLMYANGGRVNFKYGGIANIL